MKIYFLHEIIKYVPRSLSLSLLHLSALPDVGEQNGIVSIFFSVTNFRITTCENRYYGGYENAKTLWGTPLTQILHADKYRLAQRAQHCSIIKCNVTDITNPHIARCSAASPCKSIFRVAIQWWAGIPSRCDWGNEISFGDATIRKETWIVSYLTHDSTSIELFVSPRWYGCVLWMLMTAERIHIANYRE